MEQAGNATVKDLVLGYSLGDELESALLRDRGTGATLSQHAFTYDAAGNRLSSQQGNSVVSSTFNQLNQIVSTGSAGGLTRFQGSINEPGSVTVGGVPAQMTEGTNFVARVPLTAGTNAVPVVARDSSNLSRTNTFRVVVPSSTTHNVTYDAAGNILNDGIHTYQWDALNRLRSIQYGSGARTEFTYDALGRRVQILERNGAGAIVETKRFVFDGMEEAELRDSNNVVVRRYFAEGFQDRPSGGGSWSSYYITKDHLGSTREVIDSAGAVAARYEYSPYGEVTRISGSINADMLYTGHYYHEASELALTMFRAYSPEAGRWLSRDPIGEAGGINLYGYVGNNPINLWDPLGLQSGWNESNRSIFEHVYGEDYIQKELEERKKICEAAEDTYEDVATAPLPIGKARGIWGWIRQFLTNIGREKLIEDKQHRKESP